MQQFWLLISEDRKYSEHKEASTQEENAGKGPWKKIKTVRGRDRAKCSLLP
jgi:hypothetical protein